MFTRRRTAMATVCELVHCFVRVLRNDLRIGATSEKSQVPCKTSPLCRRTQHKDRRKTLYYYGGIQYTCLACCRPLTSPGLGPRCTSTGSQRILVYHARIKTTNYIISHRRFAGRPKIINFQPPDGAKLPDCRQFILHYTWLGASSAVALHYIKLRARLAVTYFD
jgi:hypothetical protein